jgi:hypothetical protein
MSSVEEIKMRKVLAVVLCVSLGGCSGFNTWLTNFNNQVQTYAPIIGKDLIMVANILVQVECSPALPTANQVASNVLNIVAPNTRAASQVAGVLQVNSQVAAQLCPFVSAIRAKVGPVPQGTPSQVVTGV